MDDIQAMSEVSKEDRGKAHLCNSTRSTFRDDFLVDSLPRFFKVHRRCLPAS